MGYNISTNPHKRPANRFNPFDNLFRDRNALQPEIANRKHDTFYQLNFSNHIQ